MEYSIFWLILTEQCNKTTFFSSHIYECFLHAEFFVLLACFRNIFSDAFLLCVIAWYRYRFESCVMLLLLFGFFWLILLVTERRFKYQFHTLTSTSASKVKTLLQQGDSYLTPMDWLSSTVIPQKFKWKLLCQVGCYPNILVNTFNYDNFFYRGWTGS